LKIRFLAQAEEELDEAVAYYNAAAPNLGVEFALEVREGLTRVAEFPDAWLPLGPRIRRYRMKRFPYGIVYAHLPSEILIVALMHLRRRPHYWKGRLSQVF
jgi:toxin ParE2